MPFLLPLYAFLLGAITGSFLNVVIHRYPYGESIVFPPSRCPKCGTHIKPWDNIPVLSYVILLGRCRSCRESISPRYPLVELANALFYLAIFLVTGPTFGFVLVAAIVSMTIVLIYIDLEIQILPDAIDLPGIAVGLLIGWLQLGTRHPQFVLALDLMDSLIGAAFGALLLLAVGMIYKMVRHIDGMGMGDVKMLAMIGAVMGWRAIFPVLFVASVTGALVGVSLAIRSEKGLQLAIPFGVFLGIATLVLLFFGPTLFAWYRSLLPV